MKTANEYKIYLLQFVISGFLSASIVFSVSHVIKQVNAKRQPTLTRVIVTKVVSPIAGTDKTAKNSPKTLYLQKRSWIGKVSHYSRSGCLGCSSTLTMANGKPLDDGASTIAFNYLPLGSRVKLTNLDNGKSVTAEVTDTGGFTELGRIADLTPRVAYMLATKTDVSDVLIEEL